MRCGAGSLPQGARHAGVHPGSEHGTCLGALVIPRAPSGAPQWQTTAPPRSSSSRRSCRPRW
ncbi:hypothetical protein QR78_21155 [Methylobacterium indicum]|uniref:Uncharacterized protein n=1 Tax=Methylobacterium indicum TaxID=1775910 RepID=A0ABR5HBV0_9HYPH|nr:hypothetical protein QR78_21155 [Methylobacterium indicum]KMO22733.1 hypothetical protein QR79_15275 [Methylobacterium indicum]